MSISSIAAIAYGLLAAVGGILGYANARSKPSLMAGLISGALLIAGGVAHAQGLGWGWPLSLVITIVLLIVFAVRFWKTRTFMPAGLMILAGVLALIGLWVGQ
ncbi:hypothetical protein OXH18_10255 [Thermocoleostomius sinensis A174]|uniref:Small integral membrane protein n=2 Tax=Thermocoleostomius TaxID=3065395 RepID=A0A9E9C9K2_9CYAN|nr:hypothetical protein OXH18_10255 [Thermocoleostomius sinensis A174]